MEFSGGGSFWGEHARPDKWNSDVNGLWVSVKRLQKHGGDSGAKGWLTVIVKKPFEPKNRTRPSFLDVAPRKIFLNVPDSWGVRTILGEDTSELYSSYGHLFAAELRGAEDDTLNLRWEYLLTP